MVSMMLQAEEMDHLTTWMNQSIMNVWRVRDLFLTYYKTWKESDFSVCVLGRLLVIVQIGYRVCDLVPFSGCLVACRSSHGE